MLFRGELEALLLGQFPATMPGQLFVDLQGLC
jgi:hypothetical protein